MHLTILLWEESQDRQRQRYLQTHSFLIEETDLDRLPMIAAELGSTIQLKMLDETPETFNEKMQISVGNIRNRTPYRSPLENLEVGGIDVELEDSES